MKKIGVFYSVGPHLEKCLRAIRGTTPEGEITLYVPSGHSVSNAEKELATHVVETERAHYSPTDIKACIRLVSKLRSERFAEFVVMFDSVQLCLLASLTRADERTHCAQHGELKALTGSAIQILTQETTRRLRGLCTYVALWIAVRIVRVKE